MLYRIITENKNRGCIESIVSRRFPGYTIYESVGYWENTKEKSLVIEIDTLNEYNVDISISQTAKEIKKFNQQESVLVQKIACESKLL